MNKGSTKKGGTIESETLSLHLAYKPAQMKKSILEIYALSVCFVTLLCFVIALGIGIHDLIQIGNPEFTMNPYEYERHQSNQAFAPAVSTEPSESSVEELTEQREKSYQGALRSERRRGLQSLTIVGIVMVIDFLVFGVHWLLAKRTRAAI